MAAISRALDLERRARAFDTRLDAVPLMHLNPADVAGRGWVRHAACSGADPEDFFPMKDSAGDRDRATLAIERYCLACPVRQHCRAEGVDQRYDGVWGGLILTRGIPIEVAEPAEPEPPAQPKMLKPCKGCGATVQHPIVYCDPECHHMVVVGTAAGASMHRKYAEKICVPCLTAERNANRERRHQMSPADRERDNLRKSAGRRRSPGARVPARESSNA